MMMHSEGVKCAVLAACAANKYILSNNSRYERLALVYYSRAVGYVNRELDKLCAPDQAPPDSLVTTVVYLYLHDVCYSRYLLCTSSMAIADLQHRYGGWMPHSTQGDMLLAP